jgi:hypothetical protein
MDLKEMGCKIVDWIYLAQDRDKRWAFVRAIMKFQDPQNVGNFLTS